jgi:hypothetical protein
VSDLDLDGEGIGGVAIKLISPAGQTVATAVSDVEGHYMLEYQPRGEPTVYTVVVEGYEDDGFWILLN